MADIPIEVWISAIIMTGLVAIIAVPICAAQWARVRRVETESRLKQDMLARGLSVADIERLTTSEDLRETQITEHKKVQEAQIAADTQVKRMQIDADLKRDMLARGLSVEEIERLTSPWPAVAATSPGANRLRRDTLVLATAIESIVETGGDAKAIAALLTTFLRQHDGPRELPEPLGLATAVESMVQAGKDKEEIATLLTVFMGRHNDPPQPAPESNAALARRQAPARMEEGGSSGRPEQERKDVHDRRSEAVMPAERRRE